LIGFLLQELSHCTSLSENCSALEEKNRIKAIKIVKHLLWKHDLGYLTVLLGILIKEYF
jgi:hypothetical protein